MEDREGDVEAESLYNFHLAPMTHKERDLAYRYLFLKPRLALREVSNRPSLSA